MGMKYDLATNFDNELIERIADFGVVKSLYGKLAKDVIGGGRPSLVLPNIGRRKLRKHIEAAHKHGIKFNYLLNASCMNNKEFIASSHREMIKLVREVKEDGADGVTVASPAFLKMVREQFPDLNVSASTFLKIDDLNKLKHFESLGANQITLTYNFNRDFGLLEKALKIVEQGTELRVIANNVCLHSCPYQSPAHANLLAHSSQSKHKSRGFIIDIYAISCGLQKIKNPAEFLMSDWIRPEDVHYYEELCEKTGKNLTLKLTDRARTTDWLAEVVKAYAEKSYEGNLLDILNYVGNKGGYRKVRKGAMIRGALTGKAGFGLLKLKGATFLPEVYINNKNLNGFMEYFKENPCKDKICYTDDKPYGECRHCYNLAEKLVHMDKEKREKGIGMAEELVTDITSGRIF